MSDRRFVVVAVEEDAVIDLFNWSQADPVRVPVIEGLPYGYEVRAVHYDFVRQSFLLRVHHPTFPEVDPATVPDAALARLISIPVGSASPTPSHPSRQPWEFLGPPPV
jgi:hypothetical protein